MKKPRIEARGIEDSTLVWLLIHVALPLAPAALATMLRLIACHNWYWAAFDESEVAISLALLALMMYVGLILNERVLDNDDQKVSAKVWAIISLALAFFMAILWGVSVYSRAQVYGCNLQSSSGSLHILRVLIFVVCWAFIVLAVQLQSHFKLKPKIWWGKR